MKPSRGRLIGFAVAVLAGATAFMVGSAVPAARSDPPPGLSIGPNEVRPEPQQEQSETDQHVPPHPSNHQVTSFPSADPLPVDGSPGLGAAFEGLNHYDQRTADHGNQFSLEPPDQGLCIGNGMVIEPVNTVVATYDAAGNKTSDTVSLTEFFTGQPQIVRTGTPFFGPFLSDPRCYFDPDLHRFFMTILEIATDPATGDFGNTSAELIAVSKTDAPTLSRDDWFFYSIDTTDAGGTAGDSPGGPPRALPSHPGCPCFGDQPLMGADKYGFYITTNEFSILGPEFNGAQFYAMDKVGLTEGRLRLQAILSGDTPIPLAEGPAYSVQPATSPTPDQWETANHGTEYFLSALDFNATLDNRIAVWAMTNTRSLRNHHPDVRLSHEVISSEVYGQPPDAEQKPGPTPLAKVIEELEEVPHPDPHGAPEEKLAGNDDRMNQVVFAAGALWSGVNTVIAAGHGPDSTNVGIAYFLVTPSVSQDQVSGEIAKQGYVTVAGQNVLFPAIGVTADGHGVITFTLSGTDYYPTAAYALLTLSSGPDGVDVYGAGVGPDDGFTGYPPFGTGTGRWGDYSAAVADGEGNVWIATEWIAQSCTLDEFLTDQTCGGTRTQLANWSTRVGMVTPQ